MNAAYVILVIVAVAAVLATAVPFVMAWFRARGARLVTCPVTQQPVRVELDPLEAGVNSILGGWRTHLKSCTHWPERQGCGQECLLQIEQSPTGCSVYALLAAWFATRTCAFCGKPFGPLHTWSHRPGFLGPDQVTRKWEEARVENLPEILATSQPVCWDCCVTETFIRDHPEMVTYREPHASHYVN
jgi:hypothetical protein